MRQRIESILDDAGMNYEVRKGFLMVPMGSTTVAVRIEEVGSHAVIHLSGLTNQEVPITAELKDFVLDLTGVYRFGHPAWSVIEGKAHIQFQFSLLGDFLDPDELVIALQAVGSASDELDDQIKEKFGGERWIDPHPVS